MQTKMRLRPVSTCAVARRLALGFAPQLAVALGSLLEPSVLEDRKRLCQEYGYEMCTVRYAYVDLIDGRTLPRQRSTLKSGVRVCVAACGVMTHAHINKALSSKHMRLTKVRSYAEPQCAHASHTSHACGGAAPPHAMRCHEHSHGHGAMISHCDHDHDHGSCSATVTMS